MSEKNNLKSKIESILFVANGPLKVSKIAQSLKVPKDKVWEEINNLVKEYEERGAGICLVFSGDTVEMSSIASNYEEVKKFIAKLVAEELTPAALEALSIIAYRGPVSEEIISTIRGINSQVIISHLLSRDFIIGEGEPKEYRVSTKLLRQLGIEKVEDLPDYEKYHNLEIAQNEEEL